MHGKKTGGRKPGSLNKRNGTIRERLIALNCDIIEYLALTVKNEVPCGVCRGTGKTKFQPAGSTRFSGERTCQSCWGSKLERLKPSERREAASDLLQYTETKLKAIEHQGPGGGPIQHAHTIKLVK